MRELRAIADQYETSRPIFKISISSDEEIVYIKTSDPIYAYRPVITPDSSSLEEIVASNFKEYFDTGSGVFKINKEEIAQQAMGDLRKEIVRFIEKNLDMKNPRQSKLYRWAYRNLPNDPEYNNVLVSLYKYMREHSYSDMKCINKEHKENILALLTAMEEKTSGQ